jgi:ABC-2 type transport system permease protein
MRVFYLLWVVFVKDTVELLRYPFNTISGILTLYMMFAIVFFGAKGMGAGQSNLGHTLEGIVVGFFIWSMSVSAYSEMTWQLMSEAQQGTLEQLYLSPFGFTLVAFSRVLTSMVLNVSVNSVPLVLMLVTSGKLLNLDVVSVVALLIPTLLGVYGIGLMMAGMALVFKRVESFFQILQFIFIALIALPEEYESFAAFLPLAKGTKLINQVMIRGESFLALPTADLVILGINSLFYSGLGFTVFKLLERLARTRGTLGHY